MNKKRINIKTMDTLTKDEMDLLLSNLGENKMKEHFEFFIVSQVKMDNQ